MPLTKTKKKIALRFGSVLLNLRHLEREERLINPQQILHNPEFEEIHKIQKGLYFVHLYSAFEKSINDIVERCLMYIESKKVEHGHYVLAFNTIALDANLMSYKAAGKKTVLGCSISIFETMGSSSHTTINETMFGAKLQNVWFDTLQQTLSCFGANQISDVSGRLKTSVDQVVEKRNAVAHGRIPTVNIGEMQRCDILKERTSDIQACLDLVITNFELYMTNYDFIAPAYVSIYKNRT